VAVEYSGCDLSIIDGCVLPGGYAWHRTTLATDTIDINNADDLFAKLPIGAVGLEAELKRSGRLAVRTTVAGQLRAAGGPPAVSQNPACSRATHYVAAISVGSFQLVSGGEVSGSANADVYALKTGGHASKKREVLREAGTREGCLEATDASPPVQCASPIQVFLVPLAAPVAASRPQPSYVDVQRATGVQITFPPPEDRRETWTLRAPGGGIVCQVPCQAWVGPVSGYFMQREPRDGSSAAILHLPQAFPHPVGSNVIAEYQALRGNPSLARWAFYAAIPVGVMGAAFTGWGIVQATKSCPDRPDGECFPDSKFLLTSGILWLAAAGAATWWYYWTREEKFTTYEDLPAGRSAAWSPPHYGQSHSVTSPRMVNQSW
jgi:hypothetical protein